MRGDDAQEEPPASVSDVLARIQSRATGERVSIDDLVRAIGPASFGAVLLLPALLVVTPLSGIPLFPSVCGIAIALVSLQMIFRRPQVWLPGFVRNRTLPSRQVRWGVSKLTAAAGWLDRSSRRRFRFLVRRPVAILPELLCALCGAAMPFLELLPLTSSLLGAAVSLMAIGILLDDGLFVVGGMAFVLLALSVLFKLIT